VSQPARRKVDAFATDLRRNGKFRLPGCAAAKRARCRRHTKALAKKSAAGVSGRSLSQNCRCGSAQHDAPSHRVLSIEISVVDQQECYERDNAGNKGLHDAILTRIGSLSINCTIRHSPKILRRKVH
jgi:hypothetical protein